MSIYKYHVLKSIGLSERCNLEYLPRLKSQTYPADAIILRRGDMPQCWTHIVSGLVGVVVPEAREKLTPINVLGDGAWFGEADIFSEQPATMEYVSLTPTRVLCMPIEDMQSAFLHQPEFARYLARLNAWRSRQQSEMLALMRSNNPQLRVVMGIGLIAQALLNSASHLPGYEPENGLEIPLKQGLLASICGVSRGVFSGSIQQLAANDLLEVSYSTLKVLRLKDWARLPENYRNCEAVTTRRSIQEIIDLVLPPTVDLRVMSGNPFL